MLLVAKLLFVYKRNKLCGTIFHHSVFKYVGAYIKQLVILAIGEVKEVKEWNGELKC